MDKKQTIDKIKSGAVNIYLEDELDSMLYSGKKLTIKLGADPSRPDLHLGHSVVLRKLRLFQELGHKVVFVIGDFTGMIGDPTGKSKTRPQLKLGETRKAGESYYRQVIKILDSEKTEIRYNSEWLSALSFEDVIKLASNYTLARILEREDFASRYKSGSAVGLHELLYPLVQGYDSVAIDADIEIGGTDQTFNLLVGRTLKEKYGKTPQVVITYPLIAGLDGVNKMSKSLDNYIGIDEPSETMFEKCMKVPDSLLLQYFELTTDFSKEEAEKLIAKDVREAHFTYAGIITAMYHKEAEAGLAKERYLKVAKGTAPENIKTVYVGENTISLTDLVVKCGFAASKSEARRHIMGKGIKLNGITVSDFGAEIMINDEDVLSFGKNRFVRLFK